MLRWRLRRWPRWPSSRSRGSSSRAPHRDPGQPRASDDPGVRHFGSHIGQAFLAEEVVGSSFGENWVSVDPNADYDKTLAKIPETVDAHPGLYHDVQTYLRERIDEVPAGAAEPIVVRIFGADLKTLRSQAATSSAGAGHTTSTSGARRARAGA
jgi:Cu/Ag efflux pump CusA